MIRVTTNGFHTNFALTAGALGGDHPLVDLFPDASHFLIGWGERDYYQAEDPGFWLGLKAAAAPTASVIHVVANTAPVEETIWRASDWVDVAVSRDGVEQLADEIAEALAYDEEGELIVLGPGRVPGSSLFLEARGRFHLFHMCNHWSAARLSEAGVKINPAFAFRAPAVIRALERKTQRACPD